MSAEWLPCGLTLYRPLELYPELKSCEQSDRATNRSELSFDFFFFNVIFCSQQWTDQRAGRPGFGLVWWCACPRLGPAVAVCVGGALVPEAGSSEGSPSPAAEPPPRGSRLTPTHTQTPGWIRLWGCSSHRDASNGGGYTRIQPVSCKLLLVQRAAKGCTFMKHSVTYTAVLCQSILLSIEWTGKINGTPLFIICNSYISFCLFLFWHRWKISSVIFMWSFKGLAFASWHNWNTKT